jgi:membrane protein
MRNTADGFSDDELMTRAAALAFYSALSFAPLMVLLLWIAASLGPTLQTRLVESLVELIGPHAAESADLVIQNAHDRPGVGTLAGLIGLAVTLFGATAVFAQLQRALNRIWGMRARPGRAVQDWLRTRLHALGLLLTLAFLLIVSLAVSALIALFVPGGTWLWRVVEALVSLAVFALIFASIFKVLPDAVIAWRDTLSGALLTALLFALGKLGIGVYLDHSGVGGAYGPAGAVIVLLVWVYYSALILLLGAELTQGVAEARGGTIRPSVYAVAVRPTPGTEAGSSAEADDSIP